MLLGGLSTVSAQSYTVMDLGTLGGISSDAVAVSSDGRVVGATIALGGVCLVTADHGNAEKMLEADGVSPHTAHTTNPVPLVLTAAGAALRDGGTLADLAPTVLALLGQPVPPAMTGTSLVA